MHLSKHKLNSPIALTAKKRGTKKQVLQADLADELEVQRTWAMFVQHFALPENSERITFTDEDILTEVLDNELGNVGVGKMKAKTVMELMTLLDFPEGRPVHWAKLRCDDPTVTCWEVKHQDKYELTPDGNPKEDGISKLGLLWHQLVGIASMADRAWTKTETDGVPGFILADGVKIGKTAEIMGFIALVQQVWAVEQGVEGGIWPPLLSEFVCVVDIVPLTHLTFFS